MESATVHVLPAFTRAGLGGNPAGVVLDAEGLSEAAMQETARRAALSETVFLLPSARADFRLRFFTPTDEVDLCGHASVAAFQLLRRLERVKDGDLTMETRAGLLRVEVLAGGLVLVEQKPPEFFETVPAKALSKALGVPASRISAAGLPAQIVSTGLRDLLVPVAGLKKLKSLKPDRETLKTLCWSLDVIGVHAFSEETLLPGSTAHARNFAPLYGIDEEAATGTSNGALACYLRRHGRLASDSAVFEQGDGLGRPSEILARLDCEDGRVLSVRVGGRAGPARTMIVGAD
jgi:PhzF family phenazine biosynthesis protein